MALLVHFLGLNASIYTDLIINNDIKALETTSISVDYPKRFISPKNNIF